jgi:hypothetical protein
MQDHSDHTIHSMSDAVHVRKSYHQPQLRDFGTVNDLTLTQIVGPNPDGGTLPNIYGS